MTGARGVHDVSPELRDSVLAALLAMKDNEGAVPASAVREARAVLGYAYTERTIWRWIQRREVPRWRRSAWTPKPEYREELLRCGSVEELHHQLVEVQRIESVSVRTMQRAFQREFGTVAMTFIRSGYDAAHAKTPTTNMPVGDINEEWSMDDTQIPVWCILPGGEIAKPQLQAIRDRSSRLILTYVVSPYVMNTEDAVENIANAVSGRTTSNGVFVGGKPRALRTDRGSNFIHTATSLGLIAQKIDRRYSAPYEPQGNGAHERWHRTIKSWFKRVEGFDWSDYKKGDRRKAHEPPAVDQLVFFEELVAVAARKVHEYNTERVHSALGMTPEEYWERQALAEPESVQRADTVAIRAAMRQTMQRHLTRRRIQWENRFYNLHPQSVHEADEDPSVIERRLKRIRDAEGKEVAVRYLTNRVEYLSVYTLKGEYLGDAVWDKIQTREQAAETSAERREHVKTMKADMEALAIADAEGVAKRAAAAREASDGLDHYDQYDEHDTAASASPSDVPRALPPDLGHGCDYAAVGSVAARRAS